MNLIVSTTNTTITDCRGLKFKNYEIFGFKLEHKNNVFTRFDVERFIKKLKIITKKSKNNQKYNVYEFYVLETVFT